MPNNNMPPISPSVENPVALANKSVRESSSLKSDRSMEKSVSFNFNLEISLSLRPTSDSVLYKTCLKFHIEPLRPWISPFKS